MSGGALCDYKQYVISDIADSVEKYLDGRELDKDDVQDYIDDCCLDFMQADYVRKHHRTPPNPYEFSKATLAEMRKGVNILRKAYIYAQRIDWLLSGDDGEESFHERLKEELDELKGEEE